MALKIVVVGAGIAGLTAALALRQQGHHCTLLEKSSFLQETGAAVFVGANVSGLLRQLGYESDMYGGNDITGMTRYGADGNIIFHLDLSKITKDWKEQWLLCHRVDLHSGLREKVLDPEGKGPVPNLVLGCTVTNINSAEGTIDLDDGRRFSGDLIIGADGNRSVSRLEIQPDARLIPYGKSCHRWLMPMDTVRQDPELARFFEKDGCYGEFHSEDRKVVFYPCRKNTTLNLAVFVPDNEREEHKNMTNKAFIEQAFSRFFPAARKLLSYADPDVKAWQLMDMDQLPCWYKNKLVLIGDAAHPFLPFMGMGAATAIEDAISIATLLPPGTPAEDVRERVKLYQDIRRERANLLQWASRVNGLDEKPKDFDFRSILLGAHIFNERENSEQKLEEWLHRKEQLNEA